MEEKILKQMIKAVDETVTAYKSDFYTCDLRRLLSFDDVPDFLWSVRKYGTNLRTFDEKEFKDDLRKNEAARFVFMRDKDKEVSDIIHYIDIKDARVFLYFHDVQNKGKLVELTGEHDVIRDAVENRWNHLKTVGMEVLDEFEHEQPYYNKHIPVRFTTDEVRKSVLKLGRKNPNLLKILRRFQEYSRTAVNEVIWVGKDYFMDYSFTFSETRNGKIELSGGIIYNVEKDKWEIHT